MARKKLENTKAVETTSTIVGNGTEEKVTATVEPTVTDKTEEKELLMVEPINLKEQKKEYNRLVGLIKKEYGKVENSSLNIAFALHQIYSQELYLHDGFKNISECGEEHFNLGKTTVNSFINVIEKFGKRDENGNILYGKEQSITEEFEKFTWSKLCLLTSVPCEYLGLFDNSMTAKQIREKKQEIAKLITSNEEPKVIDEAETEPSETVKSETTETETVESDSENESDETNRKGIIPMRSCCSVEELKEVCADETLMFAMKLQFEKLSKEFGADKLPHIEIVFTFNE